MPYWLDGFIPLAYLLEDEGMIRRAQRYVDDILTPSGRTAGSVPAAMRSGETMTSGPCS